MNRTPSPRACAGFPMPARALLPALCLAFLAPAFAASGVIDGDAADAHANSDGTVTYQTQPYGRVGADAGIRHSVVHLFRIPSSILNDPAQQFSAATYSIRTVQGSAMTVNADLYGIGYDDIAAVQASDFFEGPSDAANTLIQDNFLTPSTPAYSVVSSSGAPLVGYLNACLAAARSSGASSAYAYLRLNLDAYLWSDVYIVGMNEAGGGYVPTLGYTTTSSSAWSQVPIGGGGFVTGLVSDAAGSVLLARTDVGGLYKWNAAAGDWSNLTDKIVPTTTRTHGIIGLLQTISVAIDPSDSAKLYVAVGGGNVSGAAAGIYASADGGSTWSEITTGTPNFAINGNGDRADGERLVVDPNNSSILWYGSENNGLIKGVKNGSAWTWSQVSTASVPAGTAAKGVRFVACDKNGSATITYAGVYDSAGTTGGVYKSTDGVNWSKIAGIALARPSRAHVANDGTLFVTGYGAVYKMTRAGAVATITPGSSTLDYRGLAISPDGAVVCVSNVNPGTCEIWRSTSGGASGTWKTQGTANFNNWNNSASRVYPQEPDGTRSYSFQWFGNIAALWINPSDTNELWASDFYGVQRTQQADRIGNSAVGAQPVWYRLLKNLEEMVVFAVRNAPSGNRLVSGVADIGGFRHASDLTLRPFAAGNGGNLNATSGRNITSLDFSEGTPSAWAYAWAHDSASGTGAVSLDGGNTWRRFGQIARRNVANSSAAGWENFDLGVYLARQRAKGVTTVTLLVAGGDPWWENTPSMSFGSRESANPPRLVLNGGAAVLNPVADTYVYKNAATTNHGNSTSLLIRYNGGLDTWSYLKFDLNSVATIADAQLQLYRNASAGTSTLDVGVHACASTSWVEGNGGTDNTPAGEMTYNNRAYALSDASAGNPLSSAPSYQQGGVNLRGGRIAVSATNPDIMVWVSIANTARYSDDRGVTWTASTGAPASQITGIYTNGGSLDSCGQNLAADRVNGHFYLATFTGTGHLIYRSVDGGKTWSHVGTANNGGTYNMRTPQLVAAPPSAAYPSGGDIWLCDDSAYNNAGYPAGGLWRSTDGGASWTRITTIGRVSQVAFGKALSTGHYAVYAHGESNPGGLRRILRSDDYGASWTALPEIPSDIPILSLAGDRQNHGKVFIGTSGRGVFIGQ